MSLSHSELTAKLTDRDFQESVHSKRRFAVKSHFRGKSGGESGVDNNRDASDKSVVKLTQKGAAYIAVDDTLDAWSTPVSNIANQSSADSDAEDLSKRKEAEGKEGGAGKLPPQRKAKEEEVEEETFVRVEADITFEDLEGEEEKDGARGDGEQKSTMNPKAETKDAKTFGVRQLPSMYLSAEERPRVGKPIDLTRRRREEAIVAESTSTSSSQAAAALFSSSPSNKTSTTSSSSTIPSKPPSTISFPLSKTSGGQSYILTTSDAATPLPVGGRLPPIKRAPPQHLQQRLQHRRRLPPLPQQQKERQNLSGKKRKEKEGFSSGAEYLGLKHEEDYDDDDVEDLFQNPLNGDSAKMSGSQGDAAWGAVAASSTAADAAAEKATSLEDKLAAASQRREEDLERRSLASRRNQERGEEVRRRKEEKKRIVEEWKERVMDQRDVRLKETKDLFDELDF